MANMSYCRFENTYKDLKDCQDALNEAGSIKKVENGADEQEREYVRKLVQLCREITDEFGDELNNE